LGNKESIVGVVPSVGAEEYIVSDTENYITYNIAPLIYPGYLILEVIDDNSCSYDSQLTICNNSTPLSVRVSALKNMRIDNLEEVLEIPDSAALFHGLNLEILGGFALVLGVAVVALALTALMLTPMAPLVPIGITLAGAGLATAGFFGMRQGILQQHQEALHERTL